MSEMLPLNQSPEKNEPEVVESPLHRKLMRSAAWIFAGFGVLLVLLTGALTWYTHTEDFQRRAASQVVSILEDATGGHVEIGAVKFNLWHLAAEVDHLVIHGTEAAGEAPYLSVDRVLVRITIGNLLERAAGGFASKVRLGLLRVEHPQFHMIVNADGSTNQPVPKTKSTSTTPIQDTLLDLKAATAEVTDGVVLMNDKPIPFDLAARQLGVNLKYLSSSDRYGISIGLNDLTTKMQKMPEAKSRITAELELGRKMVALKSLHLETGESSKLDVTAQLENFDKPVWQATVKGNIEIKQISVLSGFPGLNAGNAVLDVSGHSCAVAPEEAQKRPRFWQRSNPSKNKATVKVLPPDPECEKGYLLAGTVKARSAGYTDEYVRVRGVDLDTKLHITPADLLLNALLIDLPDGGHIAGDMRINNWLGQIPQDAAEASPTIAAGQKTANTTAKAINAKPPLEGDRKLPKVEPSHAYVNVTLTRVTLRAIEEITQPRGFSDLGLDVAVSGPAKAEWGGDFAHIEDSVIVSADLKMAPTGRQVKGRQNVPVSGSVVAEYRGQGEVVNIQQVTAKTPYTTLEASGVLGVAKGEAATALRVNVVMGNLAELDSVLTAIGFDSQEKRGASALPVDLQGAATFRGTASGALAQLDIKGHLEATGVEAKISSDSTILVDSLVADAEYTPQGLAVAESTIKRGNSVLHAHGAVKAHRVAVRRSVTYEWDKESEVDAQVQLVDASAAEALQMAGQQSLQVTGTLNVNAHLRGTIGNLKGDGVVALRDGVAYGEPFQLVQTNLNVHDQTIDANDLLIRAHNVQVLTGSAGYDIDTKQVHAHLQARDLRLSGFETVKSKGLPVDGVVSAVVDAQGTLEQPNLKANLRVTNVTLQGSPVGELTADVHSQGSTVFLQGRSTLLNAGMNMDAQAQLTGNYESQGKLEFSNLNVDNVLKSLGNTKLKATSNLAGTVNFAGPLKTPQQLRGNAEVRNVDVTVAGLSFKTDAPVRASLDNGIVRLQPVHVTGSDTDLRAEGSVQVLGVTDPKGGKLDVKASGSANLAVLHTVQPSLLSSGGITFTVGASGTMSSPSLTGRVEMKNANLAYEDIPNGLSNMNGTLVFNQDRLEVQSVTATTGGGQLKLGGFITYRHGLYADLTATANAARIRLYGVSTTANANIHLIGNGNSMQLSGDILITRFGLSEEFDFAQFAGSGGIAAPPDPDDFLNKVHLNVRVTSSPQLDFQNSYAKLAGKVDLRVVGTLAVPSVLGRVSITDGSASFAGVQYQLQRGDVYFNNPVRIDPVIDLDATARVGTYDITIGLHGTSTSLKPTYRSEPPLSEADIFALLALGRTQEQAQIYQEQQLRSGTDPTTSALLGSALNATVSSRVSKLFGGQSSVKIDPSYTGAVGNSSARITVEQQFSRQLTMVFATNVNSSARQLIQLQYQVNRNNSIVATRDENGVFSIVYKIRKRYK
ncbi:translocation/assembly module TamB domain-containing protein [Terriglobus tenax]|uniref:translocation/assembly module TamB domain-containing protein n=1 Tax=Terriglobus tenax TaxID=1111115 RepID=UPI0021E03A89|nr:translocation/assembly module TamB domain-containing protein [Terriglobus tenax]